MLSTKGLVESGAICIAYETVTDVRGGLPLLPELGYAPVNRYLPPRPRRAGGGRS